VIWTPWQQGLEWQMCSKWLLLYAKNHTWDVSDSSVEHQWFISFPSVSRA
jgi:hypothetical protein